MAVKLLLGDEAVGQGALDAGISGCYAYPGTPSTEIMEYIQAAKLTRLRAIHAEWSANEKCAMEEALGMSYAGRRVLVCMKHVGLNVAADAFVNAAITGVGGGLVLTVADDPSMHSSQNEQDSRFYAEFAHVPCLEPSNQQEAYEMVAYGFELSEKLQVPVVLRITTRIAHSRAVVEVREPRAENDMRLPDDPRRFVLLPNIARKSYVKLLEKEASMVESSESGGMNQLFHGDDRSRGLIACGIAYNYVMENFADGCPYPLLKISQYPLPVAQIRQLFDECDEIHLFEEGAPYIESQLNGPLGSSKPVRGRLTGDLPRTGELDPDSVAAFLGVTREKRPESSLMQVRPPRLCQGCPHIASYQALCEVLKEAGPGHVFSDIGCYTLGALPPFEAIDTCVDMGASVSMAKGAADAGLLPAVAVIGDSTFTHSGMTPLLDAVWEKSPITVLILDNGTTGMTGGQDSIGSGRLDEIVIGLGVPKEHVRILEPLPKNHEANVQILREEIFEHDGVSVVIACRECIQTLRKKPRQA